MVKITNGINIFEVTKGAFDGIYSKQGYKLMNTDNVYQTEEETTNKTDDELFLDEVYTKPISQWNKDEIKHFAAIKNVDISGTKNAGEAKEIIKNFLENEAAE